jgi:hypothetical protein
METPCELSLSQTNKNVMFFIFNLFSSTNQRSGGQVLEGGVGTNGRERWWGKGVEG